MPNRISIRRSMFSPLFHSPFFLFLFYLFFKSNSFLLQPILLSYLSLPSTHLNPTRYTTHHTSPSFSLTPFPFLNALFRTFHLLHSSLSTSFPSPQSLRSLKYAFKFHALLIFPDKMSSYLKIGSKMS